MAHRQQINFVDACKYAFPEKFQDIKVLEIGSWDVNGSIRTLFSNCAYTGVDICEGRGVDEIGHGQEISHPSSHYDTIISCECFEHNEYWRETLANMIRMLRPGGLCVITCATTGRREHGTPRTTPNQSLTAIQHGDPYYQNLTATDFIKTGLLGSFKYYKFESNIFTKDLYFVGVKREAPSDSNEKITTLIKRTNELNFAAKINPAKAFRKKISHAQITLLVWLIGEKRFHEVAYFKQKIRARFASLSNKNKQK
jgi:SAM-dependent methyltransferase